ncbi:hypothetical protein CHLNCDRAFT_136465 [Chlorella variabilis]|uniref:Rhodanese domain-containing protein n=1 Tax=Chlorella variabilis TaxID=554065 RepID=E1ZKE6_CHLVA|nr:hypothetical protein CHLNCDRAFT_136465 [Chlorella variabilis]EFN53793.1 hypothetical protein CHLNCDRAFT_136465 [Chlorella variabilis]|eukprot:XP_005845895.1 hypothetical protein CHLNCDRAFT_136465 [Chlorella variabilis]
MAEQAQRYESVDAESAGSLVSKSGYVLLDVRTPEEFSSGHAPGAVNIPFMVRQSFPDASGSHMVVTCGGGTRGTSAATTIAEAGYSSVLCMPGGMKAWEARGLPTTAE